MKSTASKVLVAPKGVVDDPENAEIMEALRETVDEVYGSDVPLVPVDAIPYCGVCEHFECVCGVREQHKEGCRFRAAMTCPVGIECEHGHDVCPICDPCTCGEL